MKGLAISNSDLIRSVHNSFARSDPFFEEMQEAKGNKDEDVYHFIAYLPIHGALYELDGLSRGPVHLGKAHSSSSHVLLYSLMHSIGACTEEDWVQKANAAIMSRMERYGGSELHFSLMALTRDRIELLQEQIEETDGLLLSLPEDAVDERTRLNEQRGDLEHKLQLEKDKRKRWHVSDMILFRITRKEG